MKNYMVFDVGGSKVKFAVMNEQGEILTKGGYPSEPHHFEKFKQGIITAALPNKEEHHIEGIAFSCPGGVDSESGVIGGSSALPCIHGPNFKKVFGEAFNLPIEIENDANCAALGEVWKGAAKDNSDVLVMVIGTGIGGAVVKNRNIHKGFHLHGGEFGYMVLQVKQEENGPIFQTWSDLAATGALVRNVAKIKGVKPEGLDGEKIFAEAEAGDQDCLKEIDKFHFYLAQGIYNLQYVYDPEKIIIGGAISNLGAGLIDQINKKMDILLESVKIAKIRPVIEICHFRNDANLLGALYHYLQQKK